jgi:non-ribosomal peptide synthetase component F
MALFRFGPVDHALILTIHHVVSDGWSVGLFMRELGVLYDAFRSGRPSPLPELRIQYADFSLWQRQWLTEEVLERELTYWRTQLRPPLATLELPLDRPRPANQSSRGAAHSFALPADLSAALRTMARREGATPFMLLLAAFKVLLHRYTGQEDSSGRIPRTTVAASVSRLMVLPNTLVLRTD